VRDVSPSVVFGVTDRTLTVLHAVGEDLAPAVLPPPARKDYERASDKVALFEICNRIGIAVPEGIVVPGGTEPTIEDLEPLGAPVVVRPALSWRFEGERWIRGTVSYEGGLEGISRRLRHDPALRHAYLVQRKIEGHGCGLFLLARGGKIVRLFAHRRLREKPPTGGVSTLCVSITPPADLAAAAEKWAAFMKWSGLAMLEFKRSREGPAYLLEVNARPWGSMALAEASGVDFPADLLSLDTFPQQSNSLRYRAGVRLRWWWGDVDHFYIKEKSEGRPRPMTILRALTRAATTGPWPEAWDTFRRDDPMPFFVETACRSRS
jgi:predicted ATP-grasp superfamily ATP-dependent carboligase